MSNLIETGTHCVDSSGQRHLPLCLQDRTITEGDTLVADYQDMPDPEAAEITRACRSLGIETEIDDEGNLVAYDIADDA